MYNFKNKTCTNHTTPKKLRYFISPLGVKTMHCPDCVNVVELGFKETTEE